MLAACNGNPVGPSHGPTGRTDPSNNQETCHGLILKAENRCSPYDADTYSYPTSVEDSIVSNLGGIFNPYTCETFESTRETDIEQIIARSEAHDSGLCAADAGARELFTTDVENLTLAAPALNRHEKSGKDAAEGMPERNRCWFAQTVVDVRRKYNLTIDQQGLLGRERLADRPEPRQRASAGSGASDGDGEQRVRRRRESGGPPRAGTNADGARRRGG